MYLLSFSKHNMYIVNINMKINAWLSLFFQEREPAVLLKARERLSSSLDPPYKHLLKDIGHLEEGVRMLVDMRKDLLVIMIFSF